MLFKIKNETEDWAAVEKLIDRILKKYDLLYGVTIEVETTTCGTVLRTVAKESPKE